MTSSIDVVRRYFDFVNDHDWDGVAEVTVPELSTVIREFLWRANPDLRIDVEWMEAHQDKVSAWCYGSGTHFATWELPPSMGSFAGQSLAPTNKHWRAACSTSYRVTEGRIAEVWAVWDWLSLLDQLGAVTLHPV